MEMNSILLMIMICISYAIGMQIQDSLILDNTDQPVIGILTLPPSSSYIEVFGNISAYIPASYVKWIEQTGAIAIPIPHFLPKKTIGLILRRINGLLIPGGAPDLIINGKPTEFMIKWGWIYNQAKRLNTKNNPFPIWGTCLGFEAIVYIESNYTIETTEVNTINQPQKLSWNPRNFNGSMFDQVLRKEVIDDFSKNPRAYFSHHWGFSIKEFEQNKIISDRFKVIASYSKNGTEILAAIQHSKLPIFATQFHPEKNLYEHKMMVDAPLTLYSMMASQELSRIMMAYALENTHKFKDSRLLSILEFKNFSPKQTYGVFETVFVFDKKYFTLKNLLNGKYSIPLPN